MNDQSTSSHRQTPQTRQDWVGLVLAVLVLGWIGVTSLGIHWIGWLVEQMMLIQGLYWPIWIWPGIALGHAILLLVPLTPLAWFWRSPRYRAVFQTWAIAALYVLFLVPARLAQYNQEQLAAVLRIIGTTAFIILTWALRWLPHRHTRPAFIRPAGPLLPGLMLAAMLTYGWLAWGALGSATDSLLNLALAALFGLAAGPILERAMQAIQQTGTGPGRDAILGGAVSSACLLMMGSALGFNGLGLLLMLTMPAIGWVVPALCHWGRETIAGRSLSVSLFLGLTAAAPMLFVDPDELALVLNFGSRDVMAWAFYAALVTTASGLGASLVLFLLRHRLSAWHSQRWTATGTIAAWLVGTLLWALVGQPGFHGDRLLVILHDQADVSAASSIDDYAQRRQYVYETLVDHADTTQSRLRTSLSRLGIAYTPYYLVNALEVHGGPLLGFWLNTLPEVDRALHSPVLRPLPAPIPSSTGTASAPTDPQWNLTSIGADRVWKELGITGRGIIVGQSDSGAQWDHPELWDTYRGRDGNHNYNWFDPWTRSPVPTDANGHGTHTLGTIVGKSVGVAPGAEWYACTNLARNLGNPARYLDCMQFMLAPFPLGGDPLIGGNAALGAHVINDSWGCPKIEGCDAGALIDAVRALRAAGVFVVASAGNEGDACSTVDSPLALYDEAFSVGAVDASGAIAFFSSRGPVTVDGSRRTKPDIAAPGVAVLSAYPGGTYERADGTSMAGPHVAGVVALMWSANPALVGDVDRTEQILAESATPYDYDLHGPPRCGESEIYPNNALGYGLVDAYASVQRALLYRGPP